MKTKICGLTNTQDALAAYWVGADCLGFVIGGKVIPYEIEPRAQHIRETIKSIDNACETYLVTHLLEAEDILLTADYINCSGIQVSESIPVSELAELRKHTSCSIIKTLVTNEEDVFQRLDDYAPYCDAFLTDSRKDGYIGGSGEINDWDKVQEIIQVSPHPVWLAGGLNPENVRDAIDKARPYGVDVSTGVSRYRSDYLRKDVKDHNKIANFIRNAKGDNQLTNREENA